MSGREGITEYSRGERTRDELCLWAIEHASSVDAAGLAELCASDASLRTRLESWLRMVATGGEPVDSEGPIALTTEQRAAAARLAIVLRAPPATYHGGMRVPHVSAPLGLDRNALSPRVLAR